MLNKQLGVETTIYAIGFSKYHNANLLNRLAKTGSNLGNFIYIDNHAEDYDEQMRDALDNSIGMATRKHDSSMFALSNEMMGFQKVVNCER